MERPGKSHEEDVAERFRKQGPKEFAGLNLSRTVRSSRTFLENLDGQDPCFGCHYPCLARPRDDSLVHLEEGACLTTGAVSIPLEISLTLPLPPILSPAEIVLLVKIWHHTFKAHMANQIKRRNISSLTYENFPGGHPSQYCSHPCTLNTTILESLSVSLAVMIPSGEEISTASVAQGFVMMFQDHAIEHAGPLCSLGLNDAGGDPVGFILTGGEDL
ncbi:hypothetical protein F511_32524 [Dorcoceras hygrometricum]|uniref:Uncharacterized protein n=1 Tax=Dorcoceras hygrometricum TaxID=472368 RepID=A0A2Z7C346_9LAMI|nr:hypothetical protein F511_32524 [Dorcoceras hygrometricum]